MTPEKEIQNSIISYFKRLNDNGIPCYVERRQAGGYTYKAGLPDLFVCIFGQHIEIEVKRPNGQARAIQEKWAKRFNEIGVHYLLADSLTQVVDLLEKLSIEYKENNNVNS